MSQIATIAANAKSFCVDAERNFSRKRKLTMEKVISGIIGMGSGNLTNEVVDLFNDSPESPTSSAFCQQRCKITVEAFETVFRLFSKKLGDSNPSFALTSIKNNKLCFSQIFLPSSKVTSLFCSSSHLFPNKINLDQGNAHFFKFKIHFSKLLKLSLEHKEYNNIPTTAFRYKLKIAEQIIAIRIKK